MAIKFVSIKCPECGATLDIEEGRKQIFCSYCGTKQNTQEKMYCMNCGNELVPNAQFCSKCGCKVNK